MTGGEPFPAYHRELSGLVHTAEFLRKPRQQKLYALAEFCCRVLRTERVTVWRMDPEQHRLSCVVMYATESGHEWPRRSITDENCPVFFAHLLEQGIIDVSDVRTDPLAAEFRDDATNRHGIGALLALPVYGVDCVHGMLCVSAMHETRDWSVQEQALATMIAETISLINLQEDWLEGQQRLDHLAHHDDVTGLPNIKSLHRKLKAELRAPADSAPLNLVWIDLDRFKAVTEALGPAATQDVARAIARRLADTGSADDMVARLSKDEFAVVFRDHRHNHEHPKHKLAAIRRAISEPIYIASRQLSITGSLGVALHTTQNAHELVQEAEAAMLEAKAQGGDSVVFFTKALSDQRARRVTLESELREAMAQQTLAVHYQPVLVPGTRDMAYMEALVRWNHPERGLMPPGDFLPFASRAGMMPEIDDYVLRQVCRDLSRLRQRGLKTRVAVNLCGYQLTDQRYPEMLSDLLASHELTGDQLELEVTEGALKGDTFSIATSLQRIAELGVQLAIDDFGTGYSSLGRLKYLPFHKLKIDRSFVVDIPEDPDVCAMLRAIMGLAKGLSLDVVAEGIERPEQAEWIMNEGCHYLQGYLLSYPLSFNELSQALASHTWRVTG